MTPRKRKELDPDSRDVGIRFAIHLRKLIDARGMTPADLHAKLVEGGTEVSMELVKKWLRGDGFPRPNDLESLGNALDMRDYRFVLPAPVTK